MNHDCHSLLLTQTVVWFGLKRKCLSLENPEREFTGRIEKWSQNYEFMILFVVILDCLECSELHVGGHQYHWLQYVAQFYHS